MVQEVLVIKEAELDTVSSGSATINCKYVDVILLQRIK